MPSLTVRSGLPNPNRRVVVIGLRFGPLRSHARPDDNSRTALIEQELCGLRGAMTAVAIPRAHTT